MYKKINKGKAQRFYEEGKEIILALMDSNPQSVFAVKITRSLCNGQFNTYANAYKYYNGKTSYWVSE